MIKVFYWPGNRLTKIIGLNQTDIILHNCVVENQGKGQIRIMQQTEGAWLCMYQLPTARTTVIYKWD